MRPDAIVVLGGGLMNVDGKFQSTDYAHGDKFGMMGARMRVLAAVDLYRAGCSKRFVFTTGRAPHQIEIHGPTLPTEASVYAEEFLALLGNDAPRVEIIKEEISTSTLTNIKEVLTIVNDQGWRGVSIVTSDYHIPRTRTFYERVLQNNPHIKCEVEFLSAEDVVQNYHPGEHNAEIAAAYASFEGQKRLASEAQGIKDFKEGRYNAINEIKI